MAISVKSSDTAIHFGTEGWRARMADGFTFANVRRASLAAAALWRSTSKDGVRPRVVVGADRRFLSEAFAECAAETFADQGFDVIQSDGPVPTPAVSWAVRERDAVGGVMITASHNPPEYNGYKLKAAYGGPAQDEFCKAVERRAQKPESRVRGKGGPAVGMGAVRKADLIGPYLKAVGRLVDLPELKRSKLRVAHDAMHGVGAGCFERLLGGGAMTVTPLRASRDAWFGGVPPEPVPANYKASASWLARHPHDVCLVTDGDADRLGWMDGRGRALTTHQAIALILHHVTGVRGEKGRVVTTLNTTGVVLKMCASVGLPVTEVPIGFKHLCAEMLRGDTLLGVEESGSIGFARHLPERDGVLAGLMLLEHLVTTGRTVAQALRRLERTFGEHHYRRLDLRVAPESAEGLQERCARRAPTRLAGSPVENMVTFDGTKYVARDGAWLMIRRSGTEPLIRIYAEADTEARVERLIRLGRRIVG